MKIIFWYAGVVLAVLLLILSIILHSMGITAACVVLCVQLKKTSSKVDILKVYQKNGCL